MKKKNQKELAGAMQQRSRRPYTGNSEGNMFTVQMSIQNTLIPEYDDKNPET